MKREFVLIAHYEVKEGSPRVLLDAGLRESAAALETEEGCRVFEILASSDGDNKGLFYEVYDDEAAFEEHKKTPHYKEFFTAIENLTVEWTVFRYWRLST
ncbi:MAG TPA: antibiotic biosynthesis monooxygenase family protein [Gammaproteobacteria bacterium]